MSNPNWVGKRQMSLHKQLEEYGQDIALTREQYMAARDDKPSEKVQQRRLKKK